VPPKRNKYQYPSPAEAPTTVVNSVEPLGPAWSSGDARTVVSIEHFGLTDSAQFSTNYYSRVTPELSSFLIENEHHLVNDFVP